MRSRSSNQRGYALTWAVMTLVIAALLAAFILPVGLAFSKRNVRSYSAEQAYLTARSAAASIAANSTTVIGTGYNDFPAEYEPKALIADDGRSITILDFEFESGYRMGEVTSARITRVSEAVQRVTATAEYAGSSSSVSAYLGRRGEIVMLTPLPLLADGTVDEASLNPDLDYQFYERIEGEDVLVKTITTYTWEITGYTLDGGTTDEASEE